MNLKTIFKGIGSMMPAILLIGGLAIIGNQLKNATNNNNSFYIQSFSGTDGTRQSEGVNTSKSTCPYELTLVGNGTIDYIPSDNGGTYNITAGDYQVSCNPTGGEYNNIIIWSDAGSDVLINPSTYHFSLQNSPYAGVCMAYSGCNRDINIITGGAACGNGILEGEEQCDDGNTVNGDGCSDTCMIENSTGTRYDCIELYTGSYSIGYHCIESKDGKYTDPMCNNHCGDIPYCGDGICQANEKDKYGNILCELDCKGPVSPQEPQEPAG